MNGAFLLSILLKGIGAVLEVVLQILITGAIGVDGYGTYAAWINGADLIFWLCLSGLVKCNTFYLSGKNTSLANFKRKYYFRYTIPVLAVAGAVLWLWDRTPLILLIPLIAGLELLVLDNSSALLARGNFRKSLFGEYMLGRMILVIGALLLQSLGWLGLSGLLGLYLLFSIVLSPYY